MRFRLRIPWRRRPRPLTDMELTYQQHLDIAIGTLRRALDKAGPRTDGDIEARLARAQRFMHALHDEADQQRKGEK